MNRKGRSKRPKIPATIGVTMRNGANKLPLPGNHVGEGSASPSMAGEMVEPPSSPRRSGLRPPAPMLNLSLTPEPPESPPHADEPDPPPRDDVSVPPVDLDTGFFTAPTTEGSFEVETRDPRAAMKSTPAAAQRRAHLAKYVTAAVGLASALCVAAVVKSSVARSHESIPPQHSSFAAQAAGATPPASLNAVPTTAPAASPISVANSVPVGRAATAETTPSTADQPTRPVAVAADPAPAPQAELPANEPAQAAAESARGPAAPSRDDGPAKAANPGEVAPAPKVAARDAAQEKAQSRSALERGNMAAAIAAGERSVAIDPTDAEAWLILGAAYQQRGDAKNATRSFKACVAQGTHGPKNECAAMLR